MWGRRMRWGCWRISRTGDLVTVFRRPEPYIGQAGNEVEVRRILRTGDLATVSKRDGTDIFTPTDVKIVHLNSRCSYLVLFRYQTTLQEGG